MKNPRFFLEGSAVDFVFSHDSEQEKSLDLNLYESTLLEMEPEKTPREDISTSSCQMERTRAAFRFEFRSCRGAGVFSCELPFACKKPGKNNDVFYGLNLLIRIPLRFLENGEKTQSIDLDLNQHFCPAQSSDKDKKKRGEME
eukprot:Sdes_comp17471_c0_seq1m6702